MVGVIAVDHAIAQTLTATPGAAARPRAHARPQQGQRHRRAMLAAQEAEDVLAWLMTLR
jgi:hypothetical protein